jgi:hypothetical protein
VPRPEIIVKTAEMTLMLDDADEHRRSLIFSPYQAIRITTQDCFLVSRESGLYKGGVFVVDDSPWIAELAASLSHIDSHATFLDRSHHFIIPSGDDVVEVVAWELRWTGDGGQGSYPATR